jgi:hypothetical protein
MNAAATTPIFDALNAEFIEKGIKVKVLMSRKSPTTSYLVRSSEKAGELARANFLANYKSEHGPAAAGKVIPLQRDERGRFSKRLNG